MTNDLTRTNGNGAQLAPADAHDPYAGRRALLPANYDEAFRMAGVMAKSGMFAAKTQEAACAVLMTGMEMGLAPAQAMRGIYVVQNRPSPSADCLAAVCQSAKDICKYFRLVSSTDKEAVYETLRAGHDTPTRMSFTIEMARRANLTGKDTWKAYPEAMLRARAIAQLARAVYPDLTLGLYVPDEAEDIPADRAPRPQAQALPDPAEDTNVTRDGTARSERTPVQERQPARPAQSARAQQAEEAPVCAACGKSMTKGQAQVSQQRHGEVICLLCQKDPERAMETIAQKREAAEYDAQHQERESGEGEQTEDDPFADEGEEPALMHVPASPMRDARESRGHGDS